MFTYDEHITIYTLSGISKQLGMQIF